jgi:hypothetical protein
MLAVRFPSIQAAESPIHAGRHRVARPDPMGTSWSALIATRDMTPKDRPGHSWPSPWPWVAAIMVGSTLLALVAFMAAVYGAGETLQGLER